MSTTAVSSSQTTPYQPSVDDVSDTQKVQSSSDDFGLSEIATALSELTESKSSVTSQERPILHSIATLLSAISRLISAFKQAMSTKESSDSNADTIHVGEDSGTSGELGPDSSDPVDEKSNTSTDSLTPAEGSAADKTEASEKTGSEVTTPENKMLETGTLLGKTGGFLWKPQSDKDKKLVVLLPKSLTGKIKSVSILSPDKKKIIQSGKYSGVGNGGREHFRFTKAGASFPDGAIVLIKLNDGTSRYVAIRETSARTTR